MVTELISRLHEPREAPPPSIESPWREARPRMRAYLQAAGFDVSARMPLILAEIEQRLEEFLPLHPGEDPVEIAMRETVQWVADSPDQDPSRGRRSAPAAPPPRRLPMPEQLLEFFGRKRTARAHSPRDECGVEQRERGPARGLRLRRASLALLVSTTTVGAITLLVTSLQQEGTSPLEFLLVVLYALLFAWICTAFWTATLGFFIHLFRIRRWDLPAPAVRRRRKTGPSPRTALIMPVYNESPLHVFARLQAIWESLGHTRAREDFDLFILSDTRDPDVQIEEELRWQQLCEQFDASGRIFYRHRHDNSYRKAGNIADFVRTWGGRYRYMTVLDADSLMSGKTLVRMVEIMEAQPAVGILQAPPVPVNSHSLFARVLQFATALYGPLYTAGMNFWQAGDGSYFGHNAIIRVEPFARHCGLPSLPGREPLGGPILSHDFVEAAAIRRAGWEVWLAHGLDGSYEEIPPTMIDYAKRDRRWCQGNLQHGRLIAARGWRGLSRVHFTMAVMSYLASPLWFLFLLAAGTEAWLQSRETPVYFFGDSLFPVWPTSYAFELMTVLLVTLSILFLPKLFALILLLREPRSWRLFGGYARAVASVVLESVGSALVAPVLMLFQTKFVAAILLRRNVGWPTQQRADHVTTLGEAVAAHASQTLVGLAAGLVCWFYVPAFFWWFTPVLAGLLLAIPWSMLSSRADVGRALQRLGLFVTPVEAEPPAVVRRYRALIDTASGGSADRLTPLWLAALLHPRVYALHRHLALSAEPTRPQKHRVDGLMYQLIDHPESDLAERERRDLLANAACLERAHISLWCELPVRVLQSTTNPAAN